MKTIALDPGIEYATAVGEDRRLVSLYYQPPLPMPPHVADEIVVEFPVYYPGGAPPRAVVELAFSAGIQCGRLGATHAKMPKRVPTVAMPKIVVERRVRKRLDEQELAILDAALARVPESYRNNCTDAVRHLLVHYGRF